MLLGAKGKGKRHGRTGGEFVRRGGVGVGARGHTCMKLTRHSFAAVACRCSSGASGPSRGAGAWRCSRNARRSCNRNSKTARQAEAKADAQTNKGGRKDENGFGCTRQAAPERMPRGQNAVVCGLPGASGPKWRTPGWAATRRQQPGAQPTPGPAPGLGLGKQRAGAGGGRRRTAQRAARAARSSMPLHAAVQCPPPLWCSLLDHGAGGDDGVAHDDNDPILNHVAGCGKHSSRQDILHFVGSSSGRRRAGPGRRAGGAKWVLPTHPACPTPTHPSPRGLAHTTQGAVRHPRTDRPTHRPTHPPTQVGPP